MLAYRGYDIHDLAEHATFEEVCYLLWHGRLPNRAELGELQSQLAASRPLPEGVLRLDAVAAAVESMDTLRTLVSALVSLRSGRERHVARGALSHQRHADGADGTRRGDLRAGWRRGGGVIEPDPALGHAANFLYMLTGKRPSELEARALDVALVLHADHEFNASTFAARVAAATLTDVHSAITGAIGALKGPLHGGANTDVMNLLLEIGQDATDQKVEEIIRAKLARKEKIPGFGHRVYRTEDPRATHLRKMSEELGRGRATCGGSRCRSGSSRSSRRRSS